jgi:hypothetical protein
MPARRTAPLDRIITQDDGQLIRELTLDPARDYQAQTQKCEP